MGPQRVCETEPSCFKNTDGADWALRGAGSGAEREDARRQPSHKISFDGGMPNGRGEMSGQGQDGGGKKV